MSIYTKINVLNIIKNHFRTIVNATSGNIEWEDVLTFIITPAIIASALMYFGARVDSSATNVIITSLAIFIGLLINMVVLLFDLLSKDKDNIQRVIALGELLSNILFTILLSILLVVISLIGLIPMDEKHPHGVVCQKLIYGSNCAIFFFLAFLLLTILMVLKRMYNLFNDEFKLVEQQAKTAKEIKANEEDTD